MTQWLIRPGRDADGPAFVALIRLCWSGYPGLRLDADAEMPELRALATYYTGQTGALWVAEAGGQVVGMIAARPLDCRAWEICRVYVDPALHGSHLGHALLDQAELHAIAAGAERLMLWSDTRFDRAHRFYEKRSYVRHGPVRVLHDISNSLEFGYAKPVNGVEELDIAAARAAAARLADILIACVDDGASVSFLPPLEAPRAVAFWQRAATQVGAGERVIVAAWRNARMLGVGMLDLAMPDNQRHRGEIQKLLVAPTARRKGIGRQIMQALEQAAAVNRRSLLTLDTRAGDAAESLYRAEGWTEAGRIPGFAEGADGKAYDTILFWKRIPRPAGLRDAPSALPSAAAARSLSLNCGGDERS